MKARRYAMKDRNPDGRVVFKCIQSKANVEIYMGDKKINIDFLKEQVSKLQADVEKLIRNGNGAH